MEERIHQQIAKELNLPLSSIQGTVSLLDQQNTTPFITRYRKEVTGGLDEEQIRAIQERLQYLRNLELRKQEILEKIQEQGKCTPELQQQIETATTLKTVEDLYLPYRPKRRTRAIIAKEKGLEPLAKLIVQSSLESPEALAKPFISEERQVPDAKAAWQGAMDIVAEMISEDIRARQKIRELMSKSGFIVSQKNSETKENEHVYQDYFDYQEPVQAIPAHRILALDRGEEEGVLKIKITVEEEKVWGALERIYITSSQNTLLDFLKEAIQDGYKRLILPAITREIRNELTEKAHEHATQIFVKNLRNLLLQPPLKDMCIMAIDPGYVSGSKLAVLSELGDLLACDIMYPHQPQKQRKEAKAKLTQYHQKYAFQAVAIGNGTASRETEELISEWIQEGNLSVVYTIVNEAGASVYSASEAARDEFPELDASFRGTISIGRRLLDPLAELVKIDPKSLGVGEYQHDVSPKALDKALHDVVESVVNYVGVDVNRASLELLSYVSGINRRTAKNILSYRKEHGRFQTREELKDVHGIGDEIFTQCAGFLRVANGRNPLDNTAIHPESYPVCQELLNILQEKPQELFQRNAIITLKIKQYNLQELSMQLKVGQPTLMDILENCKKPGRDPRDQVPPPILRKEILTMDDLQPGLCLQGTVRNVVDFGAFVDIGVKTDGLVHVSQMSKQYVKNPMDVCKVGDIVQVKVLNVDKTRNRIALTMVI